MPLSPEAHKPSGPADWIRGHAAGLAGAALGVIAVAIAALMYFGDDDEVTRIPDVRVTTPFLIATIVAALTAIVRREGVWALPIAGVSLAAAAMVLGWAIVVGIIAVVTAAIILVMQELM